MKFYDLIIVGSGPAGVMAAKKAAEGGLSVLMIEKGRSLLRRRNLISGWFGQGLFKMDRIDLEDPFLGSSKEIRNVFNFIKRIHKNKINIMKSKETKSKYCRLPAEFGIKLASFLFENINKRSDIIFNTEVLKIEPSSKYFTVHTTKDKFRCKRCIVSTGKNSIDWINFLCNSLGLHPSSGSMQIGVRVEVPTFRVATMIEDKGDIKMKDGYITTDDARVNSFVGEWEESNILSACGYTLPEKKSSRTNFMVGVETNELPSDIIRDIQIINVLSNDKIKRERVEDYMKGNSVLKHIASFSQLEEAFRNIEKIFPSFIGYATMYIPEVRLRGSFPVTEEMRTNIPFLYGAGECTTRVSNLIGAMASGLVVSKNILKE